MNFPVFESDFKPAPTERMNVYHKGTASIGDEKAREWCCVSGREYHTDADAVEAAQDKYGGEWIPPVFIGKTPDDWQSNPKRARDEIHWLWLLVKVEKG